VSRTPRGPGDEAYGERRLLSPSASSPRPLLTLDRQPFCSRSRLFDPVLYRAFIDDRQVLSPRTAHLSTNAGNSCVHARRRFTPTPSARRLFDRTGPEVAVLLLTTAVTRIDEWTKHEASECICHGWMRSLSSGEVVPLQWIQLQTDVAVYNCSCHSDDWCSGVRQLQQQQLVSDRRRLRVSRRLPRRAHRIVSARSMIRMPTQTLGLAERLCRIDAWLID